MREALRVPDLPDMLIADFIRAHASETPGSKNLKECDFVKQNSSVRHLAYQNPEYIER